VLLSSWWTWPLIDLSVSNVREESPRITAPRPGLFRGRSKGGGFMISTSTRSLKQQFLRPDYRVLEIHDDHHHVATARFTPPVSAVDLLQVLLCWPPPAARPCGGTCRSPARCSRRWRSAFPGQSLRQGGYRSSSSFSLSLCPFVTLSLCHFVPSRFPGRHAPARTLVNT
jgi:hypothetical protein